MSSVALNMQREVRACGVCVCVWPGGGDDVLSEDVGVHVSIAVTALLSIF